MCPTERSPPASAPSADPATEEAAAAAQQQQHQQHAEQQPGPDVAEDTPLDPLAAFAVGLARQQAEERGDEGEIDENFVSRALAESRRMRGEATQSHGKRAALAASIAASHGEGGVSAIQAAMREHAAEVLSQQQQATLAAAEATAATE